MICAEFKERLIKDGWILYREARKKGLIQNGVQLEVIFQNADGQIHHVYTSKVCKFCRNWIDCLFNNRKAIIAVKKLRTWTDAL